MKNEKRETGTRGKGDAGKKPIICSASPRRPISVSVLPPSSFILYLMTPRWDVSMKVTKVSTSGIP
jgi:hypothetical protein